MGEVGALTMRRNKVWSGRQRRGFTQTTKTKWRRHDWDDGEVVTVRSGWMIVARLGWCECM
jgi:hypothetical protein